MTTMNNLYYACHEAAILYAALGTDAPFFRAYDAWDGLDIPASTQVEVIIRLVHKPDMQVTPELEMAEAIA